MLFYFFPKMIKNPIPRNFRQYQSLINSQLEEVSRVDINKRFKELEIIELKEKNNIYFIAIIVLAFVISILTLETESILTSILGVISLVTPFVIIDTYVGKRNRKWERNRLEKLLHDKFVKNL